MRLKRRIESRLRVEIGETIAPRDCGSGEWICDIVCRGVAMVRVQSAVCGDGFTRYQGETLAADSVQWPKSVGAREIRVMLWLCALGSR